MGILKQTFLLSTDFCCLLIHRHLEVADYTENKGDITYRNQFESPVVKNVFVHLTHNISTKRK
jgi:hypothetical protein